LRMWFASRRKSESCKRNSKTNASSFWRNMLSNLRSKLWRKMRLLSSRRKCVRLRTNNCNKPSKVRKLFLRK
jgi:hypothetical protein